MMKILTVLFALTFTVMFSSSGSAGWTKVGTVATGDTIYLDYQRIRKHGGYVYYWTMQDYLKPLRGEYLSIKLYRQGDCKLFRSKILNMSAHIKPMGRGNPSVRSTEPNENWDYPAPDSLHETHLKAVCASAK